MASGKMNFFDIPLDPAKFGPNGTENFASPFFYDPQLRSAINWMFAILYLVIACFGMLFNGSIVYVTWKDKSLHSTCNYFLAITAFCDFIIETNSFVAVYSAATGNLLLQIPCYYASIPAVVAFFMSVAIIFLISADRLLSLVLPVWHRNLKHNVYVIILSMFCFIYGIILCIVGLILKFESPLSTPKCNYMSMISGGVYGNIWVLWNVIALNTMTVICYLSIYFLLRKAKGNSEQTTQQKATRRIFKSLSVILFVIIGMWMFRQFIRVLNPMLLPPSWVSHVISDVTNLVLACAQASSAPILYFCSQDYRRIMRQEMQKVEYFIPQISVSRRQPPPAGSNVIRSTNHTTNFLSRMPTIQ